MGVKNIRWHMVLCVDDRGVVDLKRKKGKTTERVLVVTNHNVHTSL